MPLSQVCNHYPRFIFRVMGNAIQRRPPPSTRLPSNISLRLNLVRKGRKGEGPSV